jgi:hypothetical protein
MCIGPTNPATEDAFFSAQLTRNARDGRTQAQSPPSSSSPPRLPDPRIIAAVSFFSIAAAEPIEILPPVVPLPNPRQSTPPSRAPSTTPSPTRRQLQRPLRIDRAARRLGLLPCRGSRNRPAYRHIHTLVSPQPLTITFSYLHNLNRKSVSP